MVFKMSQVSIEQIIKAVLFALLVVVIAYGIYTAFRGYIIPYFKGFGMNETIKIVLNLIK